jgi:hypothetical protein
MSGTTSLTLSAARPKLFELADDLLSGNVDRVVLTSRGAEQSLVLLTGNALAALEREVRELRDRLSAETRPLRGLGAAVVPVETVIAELRARQHALGERKREVRYDPAPPSPVRVAEPNPRKK